MHLHFLFILLLLPLSSPSSLSSDIQSLLSFKNSSDPLNLLHSWSPLTSPCSDSSSWLGIYCSSSTSPPRITHVILQNLSLSGPTLSLLSPLSHLRVLSLKSNSLSGPIPSNLSSSLRLLFLSHNNLSGPLPSSLLSLSRLFRLDLSFNHLSGPIPQSPNNLSRLLTLRLNSNNLSGNLSSLHLPNLQDLNLSSNSLSGPIPNPLSSFPLSSFSENSALCGAPLPSCKNIITEPSKPRTNEASAVVSSSPVSKPEAKHSSSNGGGISKMAVIAIVVGDFAILVMVSGLLFCYFWRKFAGRNGSGIQESEKIVYSSGGAAAMTAGGVGGMMTTTTTGGFERGKMVFFEGTRRFELEDLLRASAEMLGKGGYGTAYKAVLDDGNVVAVKRLREVGDGGGASCGVVTRREFEAQMEVIGKLRHGNLVGLKAYYYARDEKLLVYEYMAVGSLFALLHGEYSATLSLGHFSLYFALC